MIQAVSNHPLPLVSTKSPALIEQGTWWWGHRVVMPSGPRGSLLGTWSGAFCATVISGSYLKWCLVCTTLGMIKTSFPTFQSGHTLTSKGPGTCSLKGGLGVGMNRMEGRDGVNIVRTPTSLLLSYTIEICQNLQRTCYVLHRAGGRGVTMTNAFPAAEECSF